MGSVCVGSYRLLFLEGEIMKRLAWITVAVLVLAGWSYAAPAFNLDGRMFIWTPRDHTDNLGTSTYYNIAELNYIDWTNGTPGASTQLATMLNETNDSIGFVINRNAHLMNNGNVLAIAGDNNSYNQYSLWEIDRTTGAATRRYNGMTQSNIGYTPCIALDPDNNSECYSISTGWGNYYKLRDLTGDGSYDTAEAVTVNDSPPHQRTQDAHMWGGVAYSIGKNAWDGPLLGASSMTDNVNTAYNWYDDHDSYAEADFYLWVGDPNNNGHADVFFNVPGAGNSTYTRSIFHYEDMDDNAYFEASEFVDQWQMSGGESPRDIVGVTDGSGAWMLVVVDDDRDLWYVNLLDNGVMDEKGTLGVQLDAFITGGQYIMMDQTQIPEPATLLVVGTGALAILGYVRRRRMR